MPPAQQQQPQQVQIREFEKLSTALITLGVQTIKKNPVKVGLYALGMLIFLFFQGLKISATQRAEYNQQLSKLDTDTLNSLENEMVSAYNHYYSLRWNYIIYESCSGECLHWKNLYHEKKLNFQSFEKQENDKIALAKSKLGIFSEYGVDETRTVFQNSFQFGKRIATRQTQWDFFMNTFSMGLGGFGGGGYGNNRRDDAFLMYIIKMIVSAVFNFTMGMVISLFNFVFKLPALLASFQVGYLTGFTFFGLATLAAMSYLLTWLLGFYCLMAGGVYVGVKLVAANMRIENGGGQGRRENINYQQQQQQQHYDDRYYR
jgi:hypothetical protein